MVSFDATVFGLLLLPQVAVVALTPYMIYWFSLREPAASRLAGMLAVFLLCGLASVGSWLLLSFGVGMSQTPIASLGAHLLRPQIAILITLLALSGLAGYATVTRQVGTIGMWEVGMIAGLSAFWLVIGTAPGRLEWSMFAIAGALGAVCGLAAGVAVNFGDELWRTVRLGLLWAAVGATGAAGGVLAASTLGATTYYPGAVGPPPVGDLTSSFTLTLAGVLALLVFATAASYVVRLSSGRRPIVTAAIGGLLVAALWPAGSVGAQTLYPHEYQAYLAPPVNYSLTLPPNYLSVIDIDSDSKPDVVFKPDDAGRARILRGIGDGTLNPESDCGAPCASKALFPEQFGPASGDFNGDGVQDKVVVDSRWVYPSRPETIIVQLSSGQWPTEQTYRVGEDPVQVATGDFNGDGQADLVTVNHRSDDATFLFSNGDGTFRSAGAIPVGKYPTRLSLTDLNGDGRQDVLVGNTLSRSISVILSK
jgi:hypothetical protein